MTFLGNNVRDAFLRKYNIKPISKSGTLVEVGGRQRTVYHMLHPEHTGLCATQAQRKELKALLVLGQ